MGVLMDNMRDLKNGIKQYKKFLSICVRTNDVVGEVTTQPMCIWHATCCNGHDGIRLELCQLPVVILCMAGSSIQ